MYEECVKNVCYEYKSWELRALDGIAVTHKEVECTSYQGLFFYIYIFYPVKHQIFAITDKAKYVITMVIAYV